jgi:hypothetical protein
VAPAGQEALGAGSELGADHPGEGDAGILDAPGLLDEDLPGAALPAVGRGNRHLLHLVYHPRQ